ncbi:MAG: amidase [Ignavibacteriales bacterium]|nr:amidase [Ignavibacteriales bacterium]
MRRTHMSIVAAAVFCLAAFSMGFMLSGSITSASLEHAEKLFGLTFTSAERDSMSETIQQQEQFYRQIRSVALVNSDLPCMQFNPIPQGFQWPKKQGGLHLTSVASITRPVNLEDAAFYSVHQLAELIRTRKITSLELTEMYLRRLRTYGPVLECVVTITDSLALAQAKRADREIAAGKYRGLLHGIPYGAKDLLSVKQYPTSWGVGMYRDRRFADDATVIKRLEKAGAVLIAKLTLGELAMGNIWFGGKTKNPWNLSQGSSGSSAGSSAATSAGLVAFGIGSETWGSIVSPATRCGVTGLRPTYGRVSRSGAMALSWSMDKIGPICRTVEDCAIVLQAINGIDEKDPMTYDVPFTYSASADIRTLRIGYLKSDFDSLGEEKALLLSVLDELCAMGATLVPITMPEYPIAPLAMMLHAESAAAFDDLTRSRRDTLLVQQEKDSWPNGFRASRFIPAVEYIQASRIRAKVIAGMQLLMAGINLYVVPSLTDNLLLTNLTGHPCVVVPVGDPAKTLTSVSFVGRLFDEGTILAVAKAYQDRTGYHRKHPVMKGK